MGIPRKKTYLIWVGNNLNSPGYMLSGVVLLVYNVRSALRKLYNFWLYNFPNIQVTIEFSPIRWIRDCKRYPMAPHITPALGQYSAQECSLLTLSFPSFLPSPFLMCCAILPTSFGGKDPIWGDDWLPLHQPVS